MSVVGYRTVAAVVHLLSGDHINSMVETNARRPQLSCNISIRARCGDRMTLQSVADYHTVSMKQHFARSSSLCTTYCGSWLILKPRSIASLGFMDQPLDAAMQRLDNVTVCCSIESLWQSATNCNVVASRHKSTLL